MTEPGADGHGATDDDTADDRTGEDGSRGSMAEVSHTPPDWSRGATDAPDANAVFARGGERLGRADASEDDEPVDDRFAADGAEPPDDE